MPESSLPTVLRRNLSATEQNVLLLAARGGARLVMLELGKGAGATTVEAAEERIAAVREKAARLIAGEQRSREAGDAKRRVPDPEEGGTTRTGAGDAAPVVEPPTPPAPGLPSTPAERSPAPRPRPLPPVVDNGRPPAHNRIWTRERLLAAAAEASRRERRRLKWADFVKGTRLDGLPSHAVLTEHFGTVAGLNEAVETVGVEVDAAPDAECAACHESYRRKAPNQLYCSKVECQREKQRVKSARFYAKARARAPEEESAPEVDVPTTAPIRADSSALRDRYIEALLGCIVAGDTSAELLDRFERLAGIE